MRISKLSLLFSLILGMILFAVPHGYSQPKPEAKGPIITHAFAVDKGSYGYIWKIYIEAEDPDGEMVKIACAVNQDAYGSYPTSWTYLKPENRRHLKGYLQWNTFSSKAGKVTEGTQIALRVSIIDKAGSESKEVALPFTFQSGVKDQYQYKLPAPFDQGDIPKLGNINVDLFNPFEISK
jgi:hypothetical protein